VLAKKLSEISGLGKCFFSNSGAEAIETAIKLARKHTGKKKIIAMKRRISRPHNGEPIRDVGMKHTKSHSGRC